MSHFCVAEDYVGQRIPIDTIRLCHPTIHICHDIIPCMDMSKKKWMNNISYTEFLADVTIEYQNDLWRETHAKKDVLYKKARSYGQVYVDSLSIMRPKIAIKLTRSLMNPVMRNNCPPNVHEFVEKLWGKSTVEDNNLIDGEA